MVTPTVRKGFKSPINLDETLFSLGLDELAQPPQSVATETGQPPEDTSIKQTRILIVDDEPLNVLVVKKFLHNAGYTNTLTETDSTKALDRIRQQKPDLVLLDVMMPGRPEACARSL